jgi:hypothetical protein
MNGSLSPKAGEKSSSLLKQEWSVAGLAFLRRVLPRDRSKMSALADMLSWSNSEIGTDVDNDALASIVGDALHVLYRLEWLDVPRVVCCPR